MCLKRLLNRDKPVDHSCMNLSDLMTVYEANFKSSQQTDKTVIKTQFRSSHSVVTTSVSVITFENVTKTILSPVTKSTVQFNSELLVTTSLSVMNPQISTTKSEFEEIAEIFNDNIAGFVAVISTATLFLIGFIVVLFYLCRHIFCPTRRTPRQIRILRNRLIDLVSPLRPFFSTPVSDDESQEQCYKTFCNIFSCFMFCGRTF